MIPAQLLANVQALATAVTANAPLAKLPRLQLAILQTQAAQVVSDVDAAMVDAAGALDGGDPIGFPGDMVTALQALADASTDQSKLADIRGLVGRAAFNMNQVFS